MYHSVNVSGAKATENQNSVLVYDSAEFKSFSEASNSARGNTSAWDSQVMASPHRSKFFSLLPFHMESVSIFGKTLNFTYDFLIF